MRRFLEWVGYMRRHISAPDTCLMVVFALCVIGATAVMFLLARRF